MPILEVTAALWRDFSSVLNPFGSTAAQIEPCDDISHHKLVLGTRVNRAAGGPRRSLSPKYSNSSALARECAALRQAASYLWWIGMRPV